MLAICQDDKDKFIGLLDILNDTYFGNVYSVNKLHVLFKKIEPAKSADKDKETADPLAPPKAPDAPSPAETMIKTTGTKNKDAVVDPAPVADPAVPIKMIKSLIKLLTKNSIEAEGEKSSFAGEAEFVSAPYTTKQLQ